MFGFVFFSFSFFFFVSGGIWSVQQALWKTPQSVYKLVQCSKRAYERFDTLNEDRTLRLFYGNGGENDTSYCGFVTCLEMRELGTRTNTNVAVVTFHGTRLDYFLHDVLIDLKVFGDDGGYTSEIVSNDENFQVHSGFAAQVMSCYSGSRGFARAIKKVLRESHCQEIVFTGHSMGAAMAQLAALLYYKRNEQVLRGQNRIKVFAFSSPAIFSLRARDVYNQSIGGLNSISISVKGDLVSLSHLLYHAGISVEVKFSSRQTLIGRGGRLLWTLIKACRANEGRSREVQNVVDIGAAIAFAAHTIDDFTLTDIENVITRIQRNFRENPDMGLGLLGK